MIYATAVGFITHDIKIKKKNNKQKSVIQLACKQYKDTQFINCLITGNLCNSLIYAQKGTLISLKGSLKTKIIKKENQANIYYTYIDVDFLQLL